MTLPQPQRPMSAPCDHSACQSVRLTRTDVTLVETTGYSQYGKPDYPVTDLMHGNRYLASIRDDGHPIHPSLGGGWQHRWVAFAGGQGVCLPERYWDPETREMVRTETSKAATVAALAEWLSSTAFAWRLALHG